VPSGETIHPFIPIELPHQKFFHVFVCWFLKKFAWVSKQNIGEKNLKKRFFSSKMFVFGSFFMFYFMCEPVLPDSVIWHYL